MRDFHNAAKRIFLISQGDSELAKQWLLYICDGLMTGQNLSITDRYALVAALMGFINRSEADLFWNKGKRPHHRLNVNPEMEVWAHVNKLRSNGIEKSLALLEVAEKRRYIFDDSDNDEEGLDRVKGEYRRGQEKFNKFNNQNTQLVQDLLNNNPYFDWNVIEETFD